MIRPVVLGALLALTGLSVGRCIATPNIVYADAASIKKQIAADKGHVVLVNFWATWCGPCVAEYPLLVQIDEKYRKKGLDVIAVSLDLKEDIPGKVEPFVARQKATFAQYVLDDSDPDAAINAFDKSWQGEVPKTFIYSKSGRLLTSLPFQKTEAGFDRTVKQALTSK